MADMATKIDGLTPKQAAFVREYLVDRNGTQAAIRAGYSRKSADVIADQNLGKLGIINAIRAGEAKFAERSTLTRERLVRDLDQLFRSAVQSNQPAAAARLGELLAKMHGYIVERRDVRVVRSVTDLTDDELAALASEGSRPEARH